MTFMSQKCTNLLEKLYQMDAFARVITCLRKRGRVSLGKNWTKQCSGTMLKTNMLLQYFKKKKRSLVIFPSGSLESLQRLFFYFLKIAKENSNLFMVMLSIRMMGWK